MAIVGGGRLRLLWLGCCGTGDQHFLVGLGSCWAPAQRVELIQLSVCAVSLSVACAGPLSCIIVIIILFPFRFLSRGTHPAMFNVHLVCRGFVHLSNVHGEYCVLSHPDFSFFSFLFFTQIVYFSEPMFIGTLLSPKFVPTSAHLLHLL